MEAGGLPSASTFTSLYQTGQNIQKHGIMNRLKDGTEGTISLVGDWEVAYDFNICVHDIGESKNDLLF